MKKLLIMFMALVCTATLMAQRIAVVDSNGSTQIFKTLQAAIEGASDNSVIYLPGGGFPIADSVKITKKLTIIGIGHKANNDNVDGITTISGNLFFNEGSSGSAVVGCYITGEVKIGNDDSAVESILIRYCNLNSINIKQSTCIEAIVNQNYIRASSFFGNSNAQITNNVIHSINKVNGGNIDNNIIIGTFLYKSIYQTSVWTNYYYTCILASNTSIKNNFLIRSVSGKNNNGRADESFYTYIYNDGSANTQFSNEYLTKDDQVDWSNIFVNYKGGGVSSASDYHFTSDYQQEHPNCGIYAGDGFSDDQLAPVPYIISKSIGQQTDASGKLNVKIRVKAGGSE